MGFYRAWDAPIGEPPTMPSEFAVSEFRKHIESNREEARGVVQMIFLGQTRDEVRTATTVHDNKVGLTQCDAPFLTPIAEKLWRGGELTPMEQLQATVRAPKYAAQYLFRLRFA